MMYLKIFRYAKEISETIHRDFDHPLMYGTLPKYSVMTYVGIFLLFFIGSILIAKFSKQTTNGNVT